MLFTDNNLIKLWPKLPNYSSPAIDQDPNMTRSGPLQYIIYLHGTQTGLFQINLRERDLSDRQPGHDQVSVFVWSQSEGLLSGHSVLSIRQIPLTRVVSILYIITNSCSSRQFSLKYPDGSIIALEQ